MTDVRRAARGLDACIDAGAPETHTQQRTAAAPPADVDRLESARRRAAPAPAPSPRECFNQNAGRWLRNPTTTQLERAGPAPAGADRPGATRVWTGTFAVGRAPEVLQSSGAGPCVIVALYDPVTRVGAMTHLFPGQDVAASLDAMLAAARRDGLDPSRARAHVLGGLSSSGADELPPAALEILRARRVVIEEADVLGASPRSVQLDLASGAVSRYDEREDNGRAETHEGGVAVELRRRPRR